jgi:4-hydroxy-tetrahydrodipicolinate reductase
MRRKIICFGLGPIGLSIAKLAMKRTSQLEIIGAVDSDPKLVGLDLGNLIGQEKIGLKVRGDARQLYRKADVVLHATGSFLSSVKSQLLEFCTQGVDVVSTCEELSYPWFRHKAIATQLDIAARKNQVTILGTGVNPGFVLDALAITLSGACESVQEVRATRILDATKRRLPFQQKVGLGLTVEQFKERVRNGRFGHVGLTESIALTCASMGVNVQRVEQEISPKLAKTPVPTEQFGVVPEGRVIGLVQDAKAYSKGKRVATYHIEMFAGANDAFDEIELIGNPRISLRIPGGTPGDVATAAIIINSIPRVVDSKPGLMTVKDLPPATSQF